MSFFGFRVSGLGVQAFPRQFARVDLPELGFKIQGEDFRVQGSGARVPGSGFLVLDFGFRVQGSGFWVLGSGFQVVGPDDDSEAVHICHERRAGSCRLPPQHLVENPRGSLSSTKTTGRLTKVAGVRAAACGLGGTCSNASQAPVTSAST